MKTRHTIYLAFCFLALITFACLQSEENEPVPAQDLIKVNFNLTADVTTKDVPIGSARTLSDEPYTVYGIQISSNSQPYAYGIFDNLSNLTINLIKENLYSIEATAFQKGTGNGLSQHISFGDSNTVHFPLPFDAYLTNSFNYSSSKNINSRFFATSVFTDPDSSARDNFTRPEIDRFVSGNISFTANGDTTIDLSLKRVNFGIQLLAENFSTGQITLAIDGGRSLILNAPDTETGIHILQFLGLLSAVNNPSYTEGIPCTITYEIELDGITSTEVLYDDNIFFKKHFIKKIFVSAPSETAQTNTSSFAINLEEVSMEYDSLYIGE